MADDRRIVISSDPGTSPDDLARHSFSTSFRGFDATEVRAFLGRIGQELASLRERERELQRRIDELQQRPLRASADDDALLTNLGEETARVLRAAHEAAGDMAGRAEQKVARVVREAQEEAARVRAEADGLLARRVEEAEQVAAGIRRAAEEEIAELRDRVHGETEAELEAARGRGREMVAEAQTVRERILADLTRRRRVGQAQVEQLKVGRDRLLDAYRVVRRTLDEVTEQLTAAEAEARRERAAAPPVALEELPADEQFVDEAPSDRVPEAGAPDMADDDRRSSSVRIVREIALTPEPDVDRQPEPAVEREPDVSDEPAAVEVGHVELDTLDAAVEASVEPEAAGGAEPPSAGQPAPPAENIEALFAKLRADRAEAVADAEEVLAAVERVEEPAPEEAPASVAPAAAEPPLADGDEAALQRRDALLVPIEQALARRLKRALQDEQNAVLDALRTRRGRPSIDTVLPPADEQRGCYQSLVVGALEEAAAVGAEFAGQPGDVDVDGLATDLAGELVGRLRTRLDDSLRESLDDDATELDYSDRVSSAYREFKGHRVEALASDSVAAAFGRGHFGATPDGTRLRWVVDDGDADCPDCDDDALAGPTAKGDAFPTGQLHPPAHPGCRCLLVPADA